MMCFLFLHFRGVFLMKMRTYVPINHYKVFFSTGISCSAGRSPVSAASQCRFVRRWLQGIASTAASGLRYNTFRSSPWCSLRGDFSVSITYQEKKEKSSCHDGQLLKSVRQIGIYFVSISIASSLVETKNTLLPLLLS